MPAAPVVHWEIGAKDSERLRRFYTDLFGWEYTGDAEYELVAPTQGGIGGGIFQTPPDVPSYIALYVGVDDLRATLDRAANLGGHVILEPRPLPGIGTFAMISDVEGNMIGLTSEHPLPPGADDGQGAT